MHLAQQADGVLGVGEGEMQAWDAILPFCSQLLAETPANMFPLDSWVGSQLYQNWIILLC